MLKIDKNIKFNYGLTNNICLIIKCVRSKNSIKRIKNKKKIKKVKNKNK